jgi:polar amino acid transport system substrate-binding protein
VALERAGYKVAFKNVPWNRALEMAKQGNSDAVIGANKTKEREEFLIFPDEPITVEESALFAIPNGKFKFNGKAESIKGLRVGMGRGYSINKEFDEAAKLKIFDVEEVNDIESALSMLDLGRIDAIAFNSFVAMSALKSGKHKAVKLVPELGKEYAYLAFSKKRNLKEVAEKFAKSMREMRKDGTYDKILNSYIKGK